MPKLFGKMVLNLNKFNNTSAYIPSLNALETLLAYFIETMPQWKNQNVLGLKAFHDLEHLILRKLEHSAHDGVAGVLEIKESIGMAYDRLIEVLHSQKKTKATKSIAV
jgi:hypothetical protein